MNKYKIIVVETGEVLEEFKSKITAISRLHVWKDIVKKKVEINDI